ncbi:uncharacterized protein LODBEIA_P50590 [Lodderomyces beijingensis]|uniref:Uncharacterized protein n=1 Tax=Lodderomyces beijingensis TaxID=1775926 RepID=A0ABP0ZUF5_9ASCO
MLLSKALLLLYACNLGVHGAIVPFKDSIELVFTPQDIKKTTDYVLWKVPSVKNNFKTTVKQKLLNRLLSKDLQDLYPYPMPAKQVLESQATEPDAEGTFKVLKNQNVEIEIAKPKGLVSGVLKGPSLTEKEQKRVRWLPKDADGDNDEEEEGEEGDEMKGFSTLDVMSAPKVSKPKTEHVGYSNPSRIKNDKPKFATFRDKPPEKQANAATKKSKDRKLSYSETGDDNIDEDETAELSEYDAFEE